MHGLIQAQINAIDSTGVWSLVLKCLWRVTHFTLTAHIIDIVMVSGQRSAYLPVRSSSETFYYTSSHALMLTLGSSTLTKICSWLCSYKVSVS